MFWKTETVHVCLVLCCMWNKTYLIVEYCKKSNFGQKQSARTERSVNTGKKTIQVSNFHNRAETNINSKELQFVFWRKNSSIFGNNFKPYKVRFNFLKKRKRFFLLKKILNETRNIAVSFSENGKVFYFTYNRTEKSPYTFLPKSYRGGKRHLFKRRQIGWHANKISL